MLKLDNQLNSLHSNFLRRIKMQIENLTKELDTKEKSEVRGGDAGNSAVNSIGQVMNLSVPVGVLSGGPSNTSVDVDAKQNGKIFNTQDAGDAFLAVLPLERQL
jgi:hypothetical protein